MNDLVPISVIGFLVVGTYKLFELFVRKNERLAIIEKLFTLMENNGISGDSVKLPNISLGGSNGYSWALRGSLLLIGIGLGCLAAFYTQFNLIGYLDSSPARHYSEVIYTSFISIFGGAGLLIAYLIETKQAKNK